MNKPHELTRRKVEDYRCLKKNEDCADGCENCMYNLTYEECETKGYYTLNRISLQELVNAYKDYDLKDIEIESVYMGDDYTGLAIMRPETDEEFAVRMKEHEDNIAEYNKWLENNTPEKKKQRKEEKRLAKLAKLQEEIERLKK